MNKPTNDNPKSCAGCRYDSQEFLCLHPNENKPGFWEDRRVIDGRPWYFEEDKPAIERTEGVIS